MQNGKGVPTITRTFTLNVSVRVYTRKNSLSYLQVVNAPAVPVNTMAFVPWSTMTPTSASVTALIRGRLAIHVCDAIRCNITGRFTDALMITVTNLVMMAIMIMAMVMMGYTENDNETLCCRIMIMKMKSFLLYNMVTVMNAT